MVVDIGTGDPNAVITDPTGGAPHGWDLTQVFKQFGYYATQAELDALAPSFEGTYDPIQVGTSAVAQYVLHKQAEAERQKNDPLAALQTKLQDEITLQMNQVQGLQGQLQDTLSAAPELFGSLTPDQIQTYLAPLKTSFDAQLSQVQGVMASRGLGASSTENNALAQTGKQFQEEVFSTGLGVGLESQKNKATAIQQQINNLFGLTQTETGQVAGAAAQRSQQDLGQSNLIASLPYFLNQSSQLQDQIKAQQHESGGFWDTFNKVTGGIKQGLSTASALFNTATEAGKAVQKGPNTPQYPQPIGPNLPGNPYTPFAMPGGGGPPPLFQG